MTKNFHEKPFSEGTLLKLQLFRLYAAEWLPVFVSKEDASWPEQINIVDFFAGKGTDANGTPGSPLIFRDIVKAQYLSKWRTGVKVNLHFSDADKGKVDHLQNLLQQDEIKVPSVNITVRHADFSARFKELKPMLADQKSANLLVIDQFGIKQVPPNVFNEIIQLGSTDVLIFVSSTTLRRFGHLPEIQRVAMPAYEKPTDYYKAHLAVADSFRQMIPKGTEYHIGSFSIKKGSNVHGVLFGTRHPLGIDKFLSVAWKIDPVVGIANFDINREGISPDQDFLFPGMEVPNKVQLFEEELEDAIATGKCTDEQQMINLCHAREVCRSHAAPVISRMKKAGRLSCAFRVPDIKRFNDPRTVTATP